MNTKNLIFVCVLLAAFCASILTGWAIELPRQWIVAAAAAFAWFMSIVILILLTQAYKK